MTRLVTLFLFLAALALYWVFWDGSHTSLVHGLQTIPTRTATPGASPPTVTPPPTAPPRDDDDDQPPPATLAATTSPPPSPTPSPEPISIDELCSTNPTLQTNGLTNVRMGPGLDFEILEQLPYLEVRAIIGRAAVAPWWLVLLDESRQGWIADSAVVVQGNIGAVPIAEAPLLDGVTLTPGAPWNPTPFPVCPELPTATSTPLAPTPTVQPPTAEATSTPVVTKANQAPQSIAMATATSASEPTVEPSATTIIQSPTANSQPQEVAQPIQELPTAAPLAVDSPEAVSDYFLLGGVVLVIVGIIITIIRRRG